MNEISKSRNVGDFIIHDDGRVETLLPIYQDPRLNMFAEQLESAEMIELPDGGLIPLDCLGTITTREELECGYSVNTKYLYMGEVIREDNEIIVEEE